MSSALAAEAAFWVVKLHGSEKSAELNAAFQQWLETSPAHAAAFEEVSETWDQSTRILRDQNVAQPKTGTFWLNVAAAAVMAVVAVVASSSYFWHREVRTTDVGEYRVFPLEDGSLLSLNTATRVDVKYSDKRRFVALAPGEARFDVQRMPQRPFIVDASLAQVCSLGTSFVVRREATTVRVTLIDGKVNVAKKPSSCSLAPGEIRQANEISLKPGEQVEVSPGKPLEPRVVDLRKELSWQQQQLWFDGKPLKEVVPEINRYVKKPLIIVDPAVENISIRGSYTIGNSLSFAEALKKNPKIAYRVEADRIILYGASKKPLS